MHTSVLHDRDRLRDTAAYRFRQHDITERMQAESETALSEERYALALAGSNESIFEWDLRNQHIYLPRAPRSLLAWCRARPGRSREAVVGPGPAPS